MEEGFAERASAVRALLALRAPRTCSSPPRARTRSTRRRSSPSACRDRGRAGGARGEPRPPALWDHEDDDATAPPVGSALATLYANLATLDAQATRDAAAIAELASRVAPAPVATVPLLASDVHDLAGLALVADQLFAPAESKRAAG